MTIKVNEQVTRREELKRIIHATYYEDYYGYRFDEDFLKYLIKIIDNPAMLDEVITINNDNHSYEEQG